MHLQLGRLLASVQQCCITNRSWHHVCCATAWQDTVGGEHIRMHPGLEHHLDACWKAKHLQLISAACALGRHA